MFPHDPERDAGVRAWRLAQVDGAMACEKRLGPDTVVLPTDDASPGNWPNASSPRRTSTPLV
ncbi:hypothetical protein [Streptomyces sp. SLBN-8D4]|jgi:hypothetical protein|uniref:hypothetical protein n=1 Tax=Streptomyces sp. SLBN-8D4 TaxID=3377728 RepID=UPI003C7CDB6D